MKKIVTFLAFAITVGTSLAQVNIHGDKNFTGDVNLDGDWRIKATKVTATAAELNQLDGNAFDEITVSGAVSATSFDGDGTGLTGVALDTEVFGSADITIGAIASAQVITTNAIAMLDTAGSAKSDYALTRIWVSETAYGTASTNNIESVTLTGTEVEEVVANADYWQVTDSSGEITATIEGTAAGTNYLNVSVGANVTSEAIVLIP